MKPFSGLENLLARIYKNSPSLDKATKLSIVEIWPWIALLAGLLQIYAAYALWHAGHYVNRLAEDTNRLSISLTGRSLEHPRLGTLFYLGLAFLAISGLVMIAAYPKLRARNKTGWNLLFLGILLNLVYVLVMLFVDGYNGYIRLLGSGIGAIIGFYFLYQIREFYTAGKSS